MCLVWLTESASTIDALLLMVGGIRVLALRLIAGRVFYTLLEVVPLSFTQPTTSTKAENPQNHPIFSPLVG